MQDKWIYEYAVLRLVPKVEREEFINIGILLFCKKKNYLRCLTLLDASRTISTFPDFQIKEVQAYLDAIQLIVEGHRDGGPIAKFDVPSRFRWLTAKRSTIIQTSATHSGLASDLDTTINTLFSELVLPGT